VNRHAYYYRDHAHRYARRHNRIAMNRAEHGGVHPEGLGFNGEFCNVPPSPRPKCEPDRIKQLRELRRYRRLGPADAMQYGSILQWVVSPVCLP
jgi:hypothetical protein